MIPTDRRSALRAMAEIERTRVVTSLFPAELDAGGRFVDRGADAPAADIHRAIDAALAVIRASSLEQQAQADARQFLASLGTTAAQLVSTVQPDLFYPVEGTNSVARELPLSHGVSGTLEVEWSARAAHRPSRLHRETHRDARRRQRPPGARVLGTQPHLRGANCCGIILPQPYPAHLLDFDALRSQLARASRLRSADSHEDIRAFQQARNY